MKKVITKVSKLEQSLKKMATSRASWVVTSRSQEEELRNRMEVNGIKLNPKDCSSLRKWDYGIRRWKRELDSGEIYMFKDQYYRKNHVEHKCLVTESMEDGIRLALTNFNTRTKIPYSFDKEDSGICLYSPIYKSWIRVREVKNDQD